MINKKKTINEDFFFGQISLVVIELPRNLLDIGAIQYAGDLSQRCVHKQPKSLRGK